MEQLHGVIHINKKLCVSLISILLLLSPSLINAQEIKNLSDPSEILYVGGYGPGNYSKIQDAIDNASERDTIFVFNGTYCENVYVNKRLNIIGEIKDSVIINGQQIADTLTLCSNGNTIFNLKIVNSGDFDAGLKLNSNSNLIENCIIENCWDGIEIGSAEYNTISNCEIRSNNWSGIIFFNSKNNTIDKCDIHSNSDGLLIISSSYNEIKNSEIRSNIAEGIELEQVSIKNIFQNNSVNDNGGYGLFTYWDSDETYIYRCEFKNNNIGIAIGSPSRGGSKKTQIISCDILNNEDSGVYYMGDGLLSSGTQVNYCNIYGNKYGIFTRNSPRIHINAKYNWWGSKFGPKMFGSARSIYYQFFNSRITVYPWLKSPFELPDFEELNQITENDIAKEGVLLLKGYLEDFKAIMKEKINSIISRDGTYNFGLEEVNSRVYNYQMMPLPTYPNNTLFVGGSGPNNYSKIQDAIDNSSNGDNIFVFNGEYSEKLAISKSIQITGETKDNVIINGKNYSNTILVKSDQVTLGNLTIMNSCDFDAGVKINSNNNVVYNCKIINNWDGIELNKASFNYIFDCEIRSNNREGVYLFLSDNNTFFNCISNENLEGFWLDSSNGNRFENCIINNTHEEGIQADNSCDNIFYNCKLTSIGHGYAFFFKLGSNNNLIYKCNISKNGVGLFFASKIDIYGPSDNIVVFSKIVDNIGAGIFFLGDGKLMGNNEIHYNNIYGNAYGISTLSSIDCFINAQQNWWGSNYGPKLFVFGFGESIRWNLQSGKIYFYPWLSEPIE